MQKLHNVLSEKSGTYAKWHQHPRHELYHWSVFLIVAFLTTSGLILNISDQSVNAENIGVQFTLNDVGLQTLTYNGQSYLQYAASVGNVLVASAIFRAPDGTEKPYGWATGSLDATAFSPSSATRTTAASPEYFQHIYRPGKVDSITVKETFTVSDSRTLRIDTAVTNNDPTDTLARISLFTSFLPLQTPSPADKYQGVTSNTTVELNPLNGNYPVDFLSSTWGSLAVWMGDYSGMNNVIESYHPATSQTKFDYYLQNFITNQIGHNYEDPIAPGATKTFTTYLRFGSPTDTATTLAPEAFNLMRQAYPYLVNWPDRRPIATLIISEGTRISTINPRGYLWDSTLDVSNQTNFNTRVLAWTDDVIARLNVMDPKPQGVIIWDLEGQEFYHYFTYVGNPPKLPIISPEMDAVADQMFAKLKAAGYEVGVTLRPTDFMTGTTLPATCTSTDDPDPYSGPSKRDVFVKTNAPAPYRGYSCTSPNTWTQDGARQPYHQHATDDDAALYNTLKNRVNYAKNRWGVKIFYVDSTVYTKGGSFNFKIFRQLQQDFPDVLFNPENESMAFWGASAPHNQGNLGSFNTPERAKDVYPQAFSILQQINGVNFQDPVVHDKLVNAVRQGDILYVEGFWSNPVNASILQIYRDAGITNANNPPPSPTPTPPVIPPVIPPVSPPAPSPLTPISADLNHDGVVNSLDYSLLNRKWNLTIGISLLDINQDGKIDISDLTILKDRWLKSGD